MTIHIYQIYNQIHIQIVSQNKRSPSICIEKDHNLYIEKIQNYYFFFFLFICLKEKNMEKVSNFKIQNEDISFNLNHPNENNSENSSKNFEGSVIESKNNICDCSCRHLGEKLYITQSSQCELGEDYILPNDENIHNDEYNSHKNSKYIDKNEDADNINNDDKLSDGDDKNINDEESRENKSKMLRQKKKGIKHNKKKLSQNAKDPDCSEKLNKKINDQKRASLLKDDQNNEGESKYLKMEEENMRIEQRLNYIQERQMQKRMLSHQNEAAKTHKIFMNRLLLENEKRKAIEANLRRQESFERKKKTEMQKALHEKSLQKIADAWLKNYFAHQAIIQMERRKQRHLNQILERENEKERQLKEMRNEQIRKFHARQLTLRKLHASYPRNNPF